jgi:hypothetical protein
MLNTQNLVLTKKTIEGSGLGEREGQIRSDNYVSGVSGFRLRYSGDVEFNNGIFRGKLEAATGTFKGELQAATGTFAGELQAAKGTFAGALQAASISITGTHTAGNGAIVARCNAYVTNTSTTAKLLKTLHIAGKGTCNLTVSFTGYLRIDVQDAEHIWQNIKMDTCQNIAEETRTYAITLPNNVNKIRILGWRYSWGGGSYQDFKSTICAAYVRDNPGIFSYMSYGEAHDL